MKNSNDAIGNRTRDLSACSAVPLLKALSNSYLAVDDYGYDYIHILYDLYRALWRRHTSIPYTNKIHLCLM
jgi:hypothetical protein